MRLGDFRDSQRASGQGDKASETHTAAGGFLPATGLRGGRNGVCVVLRFVK